MFRRSKKTECLCSVWFFNQSIIIGRNNNFNKIFLHFIDYIDFLSSNVKRYFISVFFCKVLWFWTCSGLNYVQNYIFTFHWLYWLLEFKCKKIFYLRFLCKVLWFWTCSGLNFAYFEEFVYNSVSVTWTIYAWRKIPLKKIVRNWIEAS